MSASTFQTLLANSNKTQVTTLGASLFGSTLFGACIALACLLFCYSLSAGSVALLEHALTYLQGGVGEPGPSGDEGTKPSLGGGDVVQGLYVQGGWFYFEGVSSAGELAAELAEGEGEAGGLGTLSGELQPGQPHNVGTTGLNESYGASPFVQSEYQAERSAAWKGLDDLEARAGVLAAQARDYQGVLKQAAKIGRPPVPGNALQVLLDETLAQLIEVNGNKRVLAAKWPSWELSRADRGICIRVL